MKKILLLTVLEIAGLFYAGISFSQAPALQWQKTIGGTDWDDAHSIKATNDGGYIVAGFVYSIDGDVSGNHGDADAWIVKLSNTGAIQWSKSLGGSGFDVAHDVQPTSDGGYIVAGASESIDGDVTGNHGLPDIWVVKLTNAGNIQWQNSYGGSDLEDAAAYIIQTTDGGYLVAGGSESTDGDVTGNHGGEDIWVLKLDNAGVIQWQKSLGGSNTDVCSAVQQTSDGGYIVAGRTASNNFDVTGFHGGTADYWVVKLDNTGTIQWQKALGGASDDIATSIQQTTDGGYIVGGYTNSLGGDVAGSGYHGAFDSWIIKLNSTGTIQWKICLGGTNAEYQTYVRQTSDGGYVLAVEGYSADGDATVNYGSRDYWIVKLNSTGVLQWQKSIGGSSADEPHAIVPTTDGGFIVAGYSGSNDGSVSGNHGFYDFWIAKMGNGTLPAELLYFKGKMENENVNLTWSTASEMNNDKFVIQRSRDGIHFTNIGEVKSQGDGVVTRQYSFDDAAVAGYNGQTLYYRLQQVDLDGKTATSSVVRIQTGRQGSAVKVLQNPARDELALEYDSKQNETISIRLVNMDGNVVFKQTWIVQKGINTFRKAVTHLPGDTYILEIAGGEGVLTSRVIKQ